MIADKSGKKKDLSTKVVKEVSLGASFKKKKKRV